MFHVKPNQRERQVKEKNIRSLENLFSCILLISLVIDIHCLHEVCNAEAKVHVRECQMNLRKGVSNEYKKSICLIGTENGSILLVHNSVCDLSRIYSRKETLSVSIV